MRRIPLLGVAFMLAACGHDTAGPSPTPPSTPGTYNLTMVDGQALPFTVLDLGAYQTKLVSGTLILRPDGTYSFDIDRRVDDNGSVRTGTDSDVGLWNVKDDALTLASTQGVISRTGVVSGDAITLRSSIRVFALTKHRR